MAGNRIKGITVEIEGNTTKLNDALKDVDKSLRDTQANLKDVNKLLKLDPTNIDLLRQKHDLLGKAVEDTKKRQEELKNALEQAKNAGDTEYSQEQQNALQRELIETTQKLESLEDAFKKSNPTLEAFSTKAQQVADKTKAVSAVAGGLATALLGNAYNASRTADDINTLSKQTGLSVEELQKMRYASDTIDVSVEDMTGSIAKLTKQMANGSDTFETLGVAITDENGNMRDSVDVWYDVLDALSKVENGTERDALAMDLFGKSANSLAGIVDDGGQALREMGDEAERNGLILSGDALASANEFNDAIDKIKATASQAFLEAGASLATTLVPMLEKLASVVINVLTWFGSLDGEMQKVILIVLAVVASISPLASMLAKLNTVFTAVSSAIGFLTSPVGLVIVAIGALIAIGVLLYQHWDEIKAKASEVWQNVVSAFEGMKQGIITVFTNIVSYGAQFVSNLATGIINGAQLAISAVGSIIDGIISTIGGFLGTFLTTGTDIIAELGSGILQGATDIVGKVMQIGSDIVSGVWQGIQNAKDAFFSNVSNFFGGIVDGVKDTLGIHSPSTVFAEIGKQMGAGLEQGWDAEIAKFKPSADILASVNGAGISTGKTYNITNNMTLNGRYAERDGYNMALSIDRWLGAHV